MNLAQLVVLLGCNWLAVGICTYTGVLIAWVQGNQLIDSHLTVALLSILIWPYVIYQIIAGFNSRNSAHRLCNNKLTQGRDRANIG